MQHRRKFLLTLVAGVVALGVVGTVALADELIGVITKVDLEAKKITVVSKDGKETVITVTKDTVAPKKGGETAPVDLEKIEARVKKAQDAGRKGIMTKIEHEKGVASKISYLGARKKAAAPKSE